MTGGNRRRAARSDRRAKGRIIRYGVVGLGSIAQKAVLPAFANSRSNSALAAVVSGDAAKMSVLGRRYGVTAWSYADLDVLFRSGEIDAVYIALPNSLHAECAIRAAEAGLHVLCEKPMALSENECLRMIAAARDAGVKLMIAYRLHFERANLSAMEICSSGRLGDLRLFSSDFCMQVKKGNVRLDAERGGGALWDIGIYCINAARNLFRDEPTEVFAAQASRDDPRFEEVPEMTSALLRFPGNRLATFSCSFGAAEVETLRVSGTKGNLRMENPYSYRDEITLEIATGGRPRRRTFPVRDQFAPELLYFSSCILEGREPEPSGVEGLADVRVIEALRRSAARGKVVALDAFSRRRRPTLGQEIHRPRVRAPRPVHAESPRRDG